MSNYPHLTIAFSLTACFNRQVVIDEQLAIENTFNRERLDAAIGRSLVTVTDHGLQ